MRARSILATLTLTLAAGLAAAGEEARLLRFADIHDDTIAFVHAGDIWVVPALGGDARRLTSHEGMELFPKFSPDGSHIAYSAEYGGNRQVYVIETGGGTPRQLTFYNDVGAMPPRGGFDYRVLDWTPDGRHVLFRANRLPWGVRMGRPYLVPVDGGPERPLPVPEAGGGMLSPDGKKFVYTPIDREFRTWKRHRGGRAQDVWIFDLEKIAAEQVTDFEGTDNQPLWVGDTIYFTSDREDGRLNLWAWDPGTRATRRVTNHDEFDVLWPSAGPGKIVYESGGYLHVYDPARSSSRRVPVRISGDFPGTLPGFRNAAERISSGAISASGKRVVFAARGDLFTVPAEKGETRNLTRTSGIREMSPAWSPDGRWIAYLSDRSGEYEIYVRAHDGSGEERRITNDGDVWRFQPVWSPDSKKLAFGDMRQRLRYVDVESGDLTDVDRGLSAAITTYRWSPDSRWLVYDKLEPSQFGSIWAYSLEGRATQRLTDATTNDTDPVFDPEGRYLYFLSDRDYNLTFSGYEFNYLYTDPTRIYAATLHADAPALLAATSDDEEPKDPAKKKGKKDEMPDDEEDEAFRIDVAGFADRVIALPGAAADYRGLGANAEAVFWLEGAGPAAELKRFSLEEEKAESVLKGVIGYELSPDGKKILFVKPGNGYGIADARAGQDPGKGALKLDDMQVKVDPPAEWRQIFADAWRITRDWFYDPGMHGVDWVALRELYEPLVGHVRHRGDLDYILGEMGGELNAGHYYVNWGDMPRPRRVDNGLLGAEIEPDKSGTFRVARIFAGENWHADFRSPLTETGVDVNEGDYILAVDGRPTRGVDNFYRLLENKADKLVVLTVNDRPEEKGARRERVRPIARETNLRYLDWVRSRREMVERLSDGRIGYLHLPNTAGDGNRELRKHFYPQSRNEALIIDVRYNGGGFIPDRMIELVARTQLSFWARRGIEPMRTPAYAHVGPKVCLINAYSSSGGDAFPYYFRKLGLGRLIGRRTWGGLIGLSGNPGFMDGGSVAVPQFRFYDTDGDWAVENVGVAPDLDVLDRPDLVARGQDPTLERAVEVLLEELKSTSAGAPAVPDPPRDGR